MRLTFLLACMVQATDHFQHPAELNQAAAALADCVAEVVYSIPVVLKGAPPCG